MLTPRAAPGKETFGQQNDQQTSMFLIAARAYPVSLQGQLGLKNCARHTLQPLPHTAAAPVFWKTP